ncbi:NYN domain-containing protein [Nocardioides sp. SYSU DS0651]|uniref:NYN domain-containing protein n=1 Tax=Nocardioides sp. SYSU DS0651 TaxID=3415955 RepID=UPI003F4B489F
MDPATTRLAVLIDADNTSPKHVSALLEELAQYGVATVKRAYGDWTTPQLSGWKAELNQHAILPVQQFSYTTGKNSTDSALIIDAMDLLFEGNLDAFAIVSSDSDFTRLAARLRESGKSVYGLGLRKTPKPLVAACDTFIYLEVLGTEQSGSGGGQDPAEEPASGQELPNLQSLLTRAVNTTSQDDGWAHLSAIGSYLRSVSSSFDSRLYGYPKLLAMVEAQPYLTVANDGNGVLVRLKGGKAPAKKAAAKKTAAKKTSATKTTASSKRSSKATNQAQPSG